MRLRPVRSAALVAFLATAVVLVTGCLDRAPVATTPAEQQLMVQLGRDPFIRVESLLREEDGFLTVRTAQGSTVVFYRLMPAGDGGGPLTIRRIDGEQVLPVAWSDDRLGTGPEHRGLTR